MGEERGDGGSRDPRDLGPAACRHPLIKALADSARAFAFVRAFDLTPKWTYPILRMGEVKVQLDPKRGACP
jgi:hypothetical protein